MKKEIFSKRKYDAIEDMSQLLAYLMFVKALSEDCYSTIYQVDMLCYKIQAGYCKEWESLFKWEEVIKGEDFTLYSIDDLSVVMENEQN